MQISEASDTVEIPEAVVPTIPTRTISLYEAFADTGLILEELPDPTLWRCLIFPKQAKKQTESGLVLAQSAAEAEDTLNYIGQVIKLGPLAGRNKQYDNPDWNPRYDELEPEDRPQRWLWDIKPMDWVLFGKFAGLQIEYKGQILKLLNDDEIVAKIDKPDNYKVYL
jgi:co-chaperonin GroES (HSP10)